MPTKQRKIAIVGSRSVGECCAPPFPQSAPGGGGPGQASVGQNGARILEEGREIMPNRSGHGKSSLAVQFVDGHFVESYYPTIENTFSKEIRFKGQDFMTEIVDTAGQDEYSILNSKHFIGIHGYMIVYSVSSLTSFEMVRTIRDKIIHHLGVSENDVPIVIVGNKSDLRPEQRQVSPADGQALANELKCGYTEASARYNENVAKAFELMISRIENTPTGSEAVSGTKSCHVM
ncbi:hypothetical protein RB596_004690 [Gaeumannomyces avenae]